MNRNFITRASRRLGALTRAALGEEPEWKKRKRSVDRAFDGAHGIDTGGITQLKKLGVPRASWSESVPHIAVDPDEFTSGLQAIDFDLANLTFIDLGSGKGRALLLASDYPFRRIIGVEFAEPLVRTARANIRHLGEHQDVSRINIVHSDVLEYDLPDEPLLIFLYNPFGASIMERVAERTRASLSSAPRDVVVLYLNAFHVDAWIRAGFKEVKRGAHFSVLKM